MLGMEQRVGVSSSRHKCMDNGGVGVVGAGWHKVKGSDS